METTALCSGRGLPPDPWRWGQGTAVLPSKNTNPWCDAYLTCEEGFISNKKVYLELKIFYDNNFDWYLTGGVQKPAAPQGKD